MHWVGVIILGYVLVLIQTSLGAVLTIDTRMLGPIRPDLVAHLAVFLALQSRSGVEAALAAWGLGLALDLTSSGGMSDSTVVGPMALGYVLATAAVFRIRDLFYKDRPLPQVFFAAVFCLIAHGTWITLQQLRVGGDEGMAGYGQLWLKVVALAIYSSALMPPAGWLYQRIAPVVLDTTPSRTHPSRKR